MTLDNNTRAPESLSFEGSQNNRIEANIFRPSKNSTTKIALLSHGGGQTRHSWGNTAKALAGNGWTAITIDLRGHGDSAWIADGNYGLNAFAEDLKCVARQISEQFTASPVSIGASLGGLASLIASTEPGADLFKAIVLVDITPKMKPEGVDRILGFMSQDAQNGFASLEEASEAIARYLPNRKKPRSLSGLSKNLRLHDDGRYRWHWDPKFIEAKLQATEQQQWDTNEKRLQDAASALTAPTLLVRGQQSELVTEEEVADFMSLVPHAKFTDVSDAGHMIAGDKNDVFSAAVLAFLNEL